MDLSVFKDVKFPFPAIPAWEPPDLRPVLGSVVIDAGEPLANINDGYKVKAPDLGAYEEGEPLPLYGPRPEGMDEESMSY